MVVLVMAMHFPLGFDFMPATDRGEIGISVELPAGSGLDATHDVVKKVEALLAGVQGVQYYQSTVGRASAGHFGGDSGGQYGKVSVKLLDKGKERPTPIEDIIADLTQKTALIPGATIRVSNEGQTGMGGQPIQMEITGTNQDELARVAGEVEAAMRKVPGVIDIKNSWDVGKPEMKVTVDRIRASELGFSVAQIASALRTSIEGNNDSKLRDRGDEFDIRIRLDKSDRQDSNDLASVIVGSHNGAPVYLRDVAAVELANAPIKIDRKNRQRLITVGANLGYGTNLGNVQQQIDKALKGIDAGSARIKTGGSAQMMQESNSNMFGALLLAILLVYMLMGALFESFITPVVIMLSLPQAMIGALLALMLTGHTMSIVTMIGIIMLVGLVTKNAILLVDYTNTLRERGMKRNDAILEAGPTRLRPILMTTLAMVGGMTPTALALAKGAEWRAPMAVAVIGGLILSTLLTLLVIPTAYTIVDDIWQWIRRMLGYKEAPHGHGIGWEEPQEMAEPAFLKSDE
jgi:HAE1 family hydrophobic/amphiphilic exporter-1